MDDPHSGKTAILLSGAVGFESTSSMHTLHSISSLRFNATRKFYFVSSHMISNAPLFHLPWRNNHNNVMLEFFEKKSFSFFFFTLGFLLLWKKFYNDYINCIYNNVKKKTWSIFISCFIHTFNFIYCTNVDKIFNLQLHL
jgi:hypothetical protein